MDTVLKTDSWRSLERLQVWVRGFLSFSLSLALSPSSSSSVLWSIIHGLHLKLRKIFKVGWIFLTRLWRWPPLHTRSQGREWNERACTESDRGGGGGGRRSKKKRAKRFGEAAHLWTKTQSTVQRYGDILKWTGISFSKQPVGEFLGIKPIKNKSPVKY